MTMYNSTTACRRQSGTPVLDDQVKTHNFILYHCRSLDASTQPETSQSQYYTGLAKVPPPPQSLANNLSMV